MLRHLVEKPEDSVGAFRMLPIKLRELFLQAYQSYLFNRFLSRRMAKGLPLNKAEIGDHVVAVERSGLPMTNMHKAVTSGNLSEINRAIRAGKMLSALPIVGFKHNPSSGVQGEIERQVLEHEGVVSEDFRIRSLPEIAGRGGLRAALVPLKEFSLGEIEDDPINPARVKVGVSFMLPRGSYATVVLRELMKPRDPVKAGF
jgi:tRNA pseudouridine13 synthase